MKRYCLYLFVLLAISAGSTQARNNIKPRWINNTPISNSDNYYFVNLYSDTSSSIEACRTAVMKELTANVERTDKVSVKETYKDHSEQRLDSNTIGRLSQDSYDLKLTVEGSAQPIKYRRIDEYQGESKESGRPCYHALFAVERFGQSADFSDIRVSSKYGIKGLALSIIPGCGQFYKGSYLKGGLMLGGCAVLAGGIILTESTRKDYAVKITQTHDINAIKTYLNRRNHFALARNICIGATAALYIYNLIDAAIAPGAKHVIIGKTRKRKQKYAFAPTISTYGDPMMTATVTF